MARRKTKANERTSAQPDSSAVKSELQPCPRCGMNGGELTDDGTTRFRYRVKCKACGWYTEFVSVRGVAVKPWNEAKLAAK